MSDKSKKIAVLLAACDGSKWIAEQVDSILNQTGVSLDLFVSVDLSIDNTVSVMDRYQLLDSRVRLLENGQRYGNAARNFFRLIKDVDFLSYGYVAFADQDDIWFPGKLHHALAQMIENSADAYSSDVIAFWDESSVKFIKKSYKQKKYDFLFESAGPGCTYVFKAKALAVFKDFMIKNWASINEVKSHDWLIYAYFRSNSFSWFIDSSALMYYRQHSKNHFGVNVGINASKKRFLMVMNKWYRGEVEKIACLLGFDPPTKAFMVKNFLNLRRRTRDACYLFLFALGGLY